MPKSWSRALHWLAQALAEPEQEATQQERQGVARSPTAVVGFGLPGDVGLSAAECCAEEFAELPRLHWNTHTGQFWGKSYVQIEQWYLGSERRDPFCQECRALPQAED